MNHFGLFVVDSVNPSFHTDRRISSIHFGSSENLRWGIALLYYIYIYIYAHDAAAYVLYVQFFFSWLRRKHRVEKSHIECRVPKMHLSLTTLMTIYIYIYICTKYPRNILLFWFKPDNINSVVFRSRARNISTLIICRH